MGFLKDFESKQDGTNDTIEFVIRVAIVTLSAVILVVVLALVVGLFVPNDVLDSASIIEVVNPAFQTIIGAFVGLLGGLSLNTTARDKEPEPEPEAPKAYDDPQGTVFIDTSDEEDVEDDMEPWEKYRNDLRYDTNNDGQVTEEDFPDWRSAGK